MRSDVTLEDIFLYEVGLYKDKDGEIKKMDKKIKSIEKKEKGALKETKELLKMDRKQDKKLAKCKMSMKSKKK